MGKKPQKGSKSKKDGKGPKQKKGDLEKPPKGLQIDPELLKELTKDLHDVFRFKNGDVYVGHFTVTVDGRVLRHGSGTYFTSDSCTFRGLWEDDLLIHAEMITYPNGSWYKGPLEGGGYKGPGTYHVPGAGSLECTFHHSRPLGHVVLNDVDGNQWQGIAVPGSLTMTLRNHFFDSEDAICRAVEKRESGSSLQAVLERQDTADLENL